MIQYHREGEILKLLENKRAVKITHLTKALYVSEATIRRDLNALERRGIVKRVYGGVILTKYLHENLPVELREVENSHFKEVVATRAAEFLQDGISIIMDGSTTVKMLLPHLSAYKNLVIITNNLEIINGINNPQIRLHCTGGQYHVANRVFFGHQAGDMLKNICADLLFFSTQGYSEDGDMTDSSEGESAIRRIMLSRAETKIFLFDHTKFNKKYTFRVCGREDVDHIICDVDLPGA